MRIVSLLSIFAVSVDRFLLGLESAGQCLDTMLYAYRRQPRSIRSSNKIYPILMSSNA